MASRHTQPVEMVFVCFTSAHALFQCPDCKMIEAVDRAIIVNIGADEPSCDCHGDTDAR